MPKLTKLPATATPLWHWMAVHEVKLEALAKRLDVSPNYLSDVRRGEYRPSDDLKLAIEKATLAIERSKGIKAPRGVIPGDWFPRSKRAGSQTRTGSGSR